MPEVEIFKWNPRKSRLPLSVTERLPFEIGWRVNNFGDLLGPLIVARMLAMHGVDPRSAPKVRRLVTVGSVLHFAHDRDVIWGTGVNGKIPDVKYTFRDLDVRAVRGPLTQAFLANRGIKVPSIFGDPALLLPHVMPELRKLSLVKQHSLTIVPNFNDFATHEPHAALLDPRSPVDVCLQRIAQSEFIVGSSLHAIVVADSLGIPARLISSPVENQLKYRDYYLGTGRVDAQAASSVDEAVHMGGERQPDFDAARLLEAFPLDLWLTE
jgi:pyruvyltransferase